MSGGMENQYEEEISHPHHYTDGGIECIDYIRERLSDVEFAGFLRGTVIKYNHRLGLKGSAARDAGKAAVYAQWLAAELSKQES